MTLVLCSLSRKMVTVSVLFLPPACSGPPCLSLASISPIDLQTHYLLSITTWVCCRCIKPTVSEITFFVFFLKDSFPLLLLPPSTHLEFYIYPSCLTPYIHISAEVSLVLPVTSTCFLHLWDYQLNSNLIVGSLLWLSSTWTSWGHLWHLKKVLVLLKMF